MNNTLNIAIIEEDKFFTVGLETILVTYLKKRGQKAEFFSNQALGRNTDIIFQSIRCGTFLAYNSSTCSNYDKPLYVAIADSKDIHLKHLYQNINKSNILYRDQSVSEILLIIENVLISLQRQLGKSSPHSATLSHEQFTRREQEVLHQLKQGKSPACVAAALKINVKTISSHKRAAMKKLNFKRNSELLHWMIKGGL